MDTSDPQGPLAERAGADRIPGRGVPDAGVGGVRMEAQDQMRAVRLDQLHQDARKGLDSGPSEPWDAEAMKQQARQRRVETKAPVEP